MSRNYSDLSKDDSLLIAYYEGLRKRSFDIGIPIFGNFLDERQQSIVLSKFRDDCSLYGGYVDADRRMVAFGSPKSDEYPISIIKITISSFSDPLRHPVILGSLMGLGVDRDVLGDIVVSEPYKAFVFVKSEMSNYFITNLTRIGRDSCTSEISSFSEVQNIMCKKEELRIIVSSLRLDTVTAAAVGTSREKAVSLIKEKRVFLNRISCDEVSEPIHEGDILVIRGIGKFQLKEINGRTKKDRVCAVLEKYI